MFEADGKRTKAGEGGRNMIGYDILTDIHFLIAHRTEPLHKEHFNFYHVGLFQVDISTKVCSCRSKRSTLQVIFQQPMMI